MNVPEDRRYTDQHEWVKAVDGGVRVGITDYAQDALGDVVFVDLPETGREITAGESIAEVESTKSVAEIYAPLTLTRGIDELSGVLRRTDAAYRICRGLNEAVAPQSVRFAIVRSDIDVAVNSKNAAQMDGKAFHSGKQTAQRDDAQIVSQPRRSSIEPIGIQRDSRLATELLNQ